MVTNLLSPRASSTPISPGRRNFAIAEIVLYSVIQLTQLTTRYMQEWRYWHHKKNQNPGRCFFYSWWSMVGLLAQIRIAGSAMVLATSNPSEPMLVAELSMQSVGISPLMFEVSLVLLRCGQSGETGPGNSKHSKYVRFALHFFRFPIAVAIALAVVGGCINVRACKEAGSVIFVVTFVFVCGLVAWLAVKSRSTLPVAGHRGVLLTLLALPFLLVRVIYFLLLEYGAPKFNPATGDVGILVGMGLLMEISIVILLLMARAVAEPIWPTDYKRQVACDDWESPDN